MSHRTTPTPAALHCVLGGLEEMLSIRMSGNPAPKQTHRDLKHMDQQFTSTSPISTGFLREKNPKQPTTSMHNSIWTLIKQQKTQLHQLVFKQEYCIINNFQHQVKENTSSDLNIY